MMPTDLSDLELIAPDVAAMFRALAGFREAVLAAAKALRDPVDVLNAQDYLKTFVGLAEVMGTVMANVRSQDQDPK